MLHLFPGTHDLSPFFLSFGRHAPSPEVITLDLPSQQISRNQFATHLVSRLSTSHKHLQEIKSDLRRLQRENYDSVSRNLEIPIGKTVYVYVRKPSALSNRGKATRFLRNYDGPYPVIGHGHNRLNDYNTSLLSEILPVINVEKVVVADAPDTLHIPHTAAVDSEEECTNTLQPVPQSELATVAFHFGEYLLQCSHHTSVVSEACKFVYKKYPPARDILSRHGRLRGLVASCPYLLLSGGAHGGTYNITVESDSFLQLKLSLTDSS